MSPIDNEFKEYLAMRIQKGLQKITIEDIVKNINYFQSYDYWKFTLSETIDYRKHEREFIEWKETKDKITKRKKKLKKI